MIPYGKQKIEKDDLNEIIKTSKSNMITTGPKVLQFENEIKKFTNSKFAVTCNSTSALYLAFLSMKLQLGDVVLMPAINFIASFNICKLFNAKIYLTDVDRKRGI